MLPNEKFALECRAWYEEWGLIVDSTNGQFAHCPLPERYGDKGYYLLWGHHQHQGLLQSKDIGECCFFMGHTKKWLQECDYFPEGYFELWDIYEQYAGDNIRKLHLEKDENGKSAHGVRTGKVGGTSTMRKKDENGKSVNAVKASAVLHAVKDEFGRSVHGVKSAEKLNAEKDENGKSIRTMEHNRELHAEKDENGKSIHSLEMNKKLHEGKDEFGRSKVAMKTASQEWESLVDGFRGNAGNVAQHNKAKGWDPSARRRMA